MEIKVGTKFYWSDTWKKHKKYMTVIKYNTDERTFTCQFFDSFTKSNETIKLMASDINWRLQKLGPINTWEISYNAN